MSMVVWTRVVVMEVVENRWLWELFQGRVPRVGDSGCRARGRLSRLESGLVWWRLPQRQGMLEQSPPAEQNAGLVLDL